MGPTWLQVQLVGGRVDGEVWCTAVGELPVGRPVGAGGALANVNFYPPATLRSKHQDLQSPHCPSSSPSKAKLLAPLLGWGWAQFHVLHGYHQAMQSYVARGPQGALPFEQDDKGLSVILPQQRHTTEHTSALSMLSRWAGRITKMKLSASNPPAPFCPIHPEPTAFPAILSPIRACKAGEFARDSSSCTALAGPDVMQELSSRPQIRQTRDCILPASPSASHQGTGFWQ